jgi:hypothetical protein
MEEVYLIYKYFVVVAVGIAKAFVAVPYASILAV